MNILSNNNSVYADYDAVIIGGGACGLMCAVQAGLIGKRILILEKNNRVGNKIRISGGGKCNYTNLEVDATNFTSENQHFCKSVLSQWTVDDTIRFFQENGIFPQEKTLGQLFPKGKNAQDVVDVFERQCQKLKQEISCNTEVTHIAKQAEYFTIYAKKNGDLIQLNSPKIIIASGGLAIKKLGSTDVAMKIASNFGINLVTQAPALVPLVVTGKDQEWYQKLSGTSIHARVSNAKISFDENILFTHWGLSGPAILQISSYWRQGQSFNIDLLPDQDIISLLELARKIDGSKKLTTFMVQFYSRKFVDALQKFIPIHKQIATLTKSEMHQIHQIVHHFTVTPASDKGYEKAEVMRGGVATSEIYPKTLESKAISGLYFGGECIDVTGWLGGYNFQWSWACGYVLANNI